MQFLKKNLARVSGIALSMLLVGAYGAGCSSADLAIKTRLDSKAPIPVGFIMGKVTDDRESGRTQTVGQFNEKFKEMGALVVAELRKSFPENKWVLIAVPMTETNIMGRTIAYADYSVLPTGFVLVVSLAGDFAGPRGTSEQSTHVRLGGRFMEKSSSGSISDVNRLPYSFGFATKRWGSTQPVDANTLLEPLKASIPQLVAEFSAQIKAAKP